MKIKKKNQSSSSILAHEKVLFFHGGWQKLFTWKSLKQG